MGTTPPTSEALMLAPCDIPDTKLMKPVSISSGICEYTFLKIRILIMYFFIFYYYIFKMNRCSITILLGSTLTSNEKNCS